MLWLICILHLQNKMALAEIKQPLVPSRFMRKIVCRLRLNEVSRQ